MYDNQHDFREGRSCITQLLQLVHNWLSLMGKRESVDAVFLDFSYISYPNVNKNKTAIKLEVRSKSKHVKGISGALYAV